MDQSVSRVEEEMEEEGREAGETGKAVYYRSESVFALQENLKPFSQQTIFLCFFLSM